MSIVKFYVNYWNSGLTKLIRSILDGIDNLDLESYREELINLMLRNPTRIFLQRDVFEYFFEPTLLPKEIFIRDDNTIKLNPTNIDFLLQFFSDAGVIKK